MKILGGLILLIVVYLVVRFFTRKKVIPLEEPLVSPLLKRRCVWYETLVVVVYEDGETEVIMHETDGIDYLVSTPFGMTMNAKLKPTTTYREFVHASKIPRDVFGIPYQTSNNINIHTNVKGYVFYEKVIDCG